MPGLLHEAFVAVLRQPECVFELARHVGVPLAAAARWYEVDAEFPDPAGKGRLFHADLALVASAARERGGQALAGLILEPQLGIDPGKGTSWPIYWVSLRTRHECKVWTIVVSPADAVVRWASDRLFLGEPQIIHVVGRDHVQPVLELDRALANPAWAALTAALHARGPHAEASAETLFQACATLPADARRCYLRLVCAGLEQDVMNAIKPSMPEALKVELSEYEREGAWFQNGLREGREEGREQGREQGREAGQLEGKRDAILLVLASKFALTEEQRSRIQTCASVAQLDRWLARLLNVDSAEALFAETP